MTRRKKKLADLTPAEPLPKGAKLINEPDPLTQDELLMALTSKMPQNYEDLDAAKKKKVEAVLMSMNNGVSMREACRAADMSDVTFFRYRRRYIWIQEALEVISEARLAVIEDRLYRAAIGYEYTESSMTIEGRKNAAGDRIGDTKQREQRKKVTVEPSLAAMIFILKNRSAGKWRADHLLKVEVTDARNPQVMTSSEVRERMRALPTEKLQQLRDMGTLLVADAEVIESERAGE